MQRIKCYTLFDITKTGVLNRKSPPSLDKIMLEKWELSRNTQSNYDTILQIISLRTQAEYNTIPKDETINFKKFKNFGFLYDDEENQKCWSFEFQIAHDGVFNNGIHDLGHLFDDANGVPAIKTTTAWNKLPDFFDTSPELKNIHFEVIND